ncbi:hypothetical protein L7F22_017230 [Adiantum nelumboides]|nr:hypothetical protein [Adiantum nelumboides]
MDISSDYLFYVFHPFVRRIGFTTMVRVLDDFDELEWLLRWLFINLDLEVHQGDYKRYLISLIKCLSDDEGEESLLGSEDSGQDSMLDHELEIDSIALDDEEEIDEGVLLGLPRGLYRMLLPREQGIVLYRQAQPYGNLQPVVREPVRLFADADWFADCRGAEERSCDRVAVLCCQYHLSILWGVTFRVAS